MTASHPRTEVKSSINITPLIDIVLVLLIVFIVLVPGLTKALSVSVPRTELVKHSDVPPEVLVVTLAPDGKVLLQRDEVTMEELRTKVVAAALLQPLQGRKLFFKVAGELTHQKVVAVLDQLRQASLQARRETSARPGYGEEDGGDIKVAITLLKEGGTAAL